MIEIFNVMFTQKMCYQKPYILHYNTKLIVILKHKVTHKLNQRKRKIESNEVHLYYYNSMQIIR